LAEAAVRSAPVYEGKTMESGMDRKQYLISLVQTVSRERTLGAAITAVSMAVRAIPERIPNDLLAAAFELDAYAAAHGPDDGSNQDWPDWVDDTYAKDELAP